jgi:hypothetical protein
MASRRQYIASALILVFLLSSAIPFQFVGRQDVIIAATIQPFSMVVLVQPTSDAESLISDGAS